MNKTIEILQHNISYWFDKDDVEIDDVSIEHIEEKIKEGYITGELCQYVEEDSEEMGGVQFETRGWWKIEKDTAGLLIDEIKEKVKKDKMKVKCGDANPNGNISLFYKGGCKKELDKENAYRCVGCGGWFHYECILNHFELEEGHDNARNALKNIKDYVENNDVIYSEKIEKLCKKGLKPNKKLLERSKNESSIN